MSYSIKVTRRWTSYSLEAARYKWSTKAYLKFLTGLWSYPFEPEIIPCWSKVIAIRISKMYEVPIVSVFLILFLWYVPRQSDGHLVCNNRGGSVCVYDVIRNLDVIRNFMANISYNRCRWHRFNVVLFTLTSRVVRDAARSVTVDAECDWFAEQSDIGAI